MRPVVHFEFLVPQPEKTIQFFETIFGWKISKWAGPKDYWTAQTHDEGKPGINGGIVPPHDNQPRTVNTIEVDDLDAYIQRVFEAGGQNVVPRMAIAGVGYLAYCTDPNGLIFGIFQADASAVPDTTV
jgi:predicted enzyme related to lactoylglutathione lyase